MGSTLIGSKSLGGRGWKEPWPGGRAKSLGDRGMGSYKSLGVDMGLGIGGDSLTWAWDGAGAWEWERTGAWEGTSQISSDCMTSQIS